MASAHRTLEHHEHAGHIAHGGHAEHAAAHGHSPDRAGDHAEEHAPAKASFAQWTALLVAFLAAGLAIGEQGAKHAEIRVQQQAIDAADAWAQYQAKSTRGTVAKDIAALVAVMDVGADPDRFARRDQLVRQLMDDQEKYERDPKDGKEAIARRAHRFEHDRHHSLEQTHAYHNGSAAYELGIVLATASAITGSRPLVLVALALGLAGITFSLLGYFAPEWGAI